MNNGKAKINSGIKGFSIIIPSKKNWFALLFGTAWMGGWFFGFAIVSGIPFGGGSGQVGAKVFITFWLLAWTIGGLTIIFTLLWGYFGKESLIEDRNQILFQKTVFGVGKKNRLDKKEIRNFRTEIKSNTWYGNNRWAFWGLGAGKIKFDYGLKTYYFGLGLDDAEANYIVNMLKEKFDNKNSNR